MDYTQILENAMAWGEQHHPDASGQRHCAFANSVSYLVTGGSGGYGGPSIREHCVTYALAGDGYNEGGLQFPDGRLPRAGDWEFEKACEFAEPICYGALPAMAAKIAQQEQCFGDDPEDIAELQRRGK